MSRLLKSVHMCCADAPSRIAEVWSKFHRGLLRDHPLREDIWNLGAIYKVLTQAAWHRQMYTEAEQIFLSPQGIIYSLASFDIHLRDG